MMPFVFIVAYLILVLVRPQEYPQWAELQLPLLPIAMIAALGSWIFSQHKHLDEPQYPLLALFLVTICLSVLFNGWAGGAFEEFQQFGPTLVAFVLLANTTDTRARTVFVMSVFASCAALLALHGVEQAANGIGWTGMPLVEDNRIQYVGIFSDPNDLGMLFVLCLPMAVYLSARGGWFGLRRVLWLGIAALLLYGVYLTNSRGAMLAVIAMFGAYVWLRRGWVTAAILGAGFLLAVQMLPSRLQELDSQENSAQGRIEAWYEGFQMFLRSPVYGVGTGQFTEHHSITAHNSLVLVLAENGFVGFFLWFVFTSYGFWMMLRIIRHTPQFGPDVAVEGDEAIHLEADPGIDAVADDDTEAEWWWAQWGLDRQIAVVLLLSLVGYAATAFFLSRTYVILPYLLSALVVAHWSGVRARFPDIPPFQLGRELPRWLVIAGLAIVAFYLILRFLLSRT